MAVSKDRSLIAAMFDRVAPRYDFLNRTLSLGQDRRWRRRAIAALRLSGHETVIDLCTGTADLALEASAAARVIGLDVSSEMLRLARRKVIGHHAATRITLLRADAASLPVATAGADAVTIAFGIRNVERVGAVLGEIRRVLKRGGRLMILEFAEPTVPILRATYLWYFHRILPLVGRLISGDGTAYSYLPSSVAEFPAPKMFAQLLQESGFNDVRYDRLTGGVVYLYSARV